VREYNYVPQRQKRKFEVFRGWFEGWTLLFLNATVSDRWGRQIPNQAAPLQHPRGAHTDARVSVRARHFGLVCKQHDGFRLPLDHTFINDDLGYVIHARQFIHRIEQCCLNDAAETSRTRFSLERFMAIA
jgi:hypothetical protein